MPYLPDREVSDSQIVLHDVKARAAERDVRCPEEQDVAVELLKGQNLPRSQRVRLVDQTEE
eukprot:6042422-Karenia_brevis.AAC.1